MTPDREAELLVEIERLTELVEVRSFGVRLASEQRDEAIAVANARADEIDRLEAAWAERDAKQSDRLREKCEENLRLRIARDEERERAERAEAELLSTPEPAEDVFKQTADSLNAGSFDSSKPDATICAEHSDGQGARLWCDECHRLARAALVQRSAGTPAEEPGEGR